MRLCPLPLSGGSAGPRAHCSSVASSCQHWEGLCVLMNGSVEGAKV